MEDLKTKNFKKMRKWVTDNIDVESAKLFRMVYDNMLTYVEPQSIPQLVLILADYSYKDSFVADHELNVVACMTEIMSSIKLNEHLREVNMTYGNTCCTHFNRNSPYSPWFISLGMGNKSNRDVVQKKGDL